MRKYETSPTCGSRVRLEDERGERRVVVGVDLDRVVALGAVERVQLLHLVGADGMSSTISVSSARTADHVSSPDTQKSGKSSSRFIASFIAAIASSRAISPPSR